MIIKKSCLKRVIKWGTYLLMFTPLIFHGAFFFPFVAAKTLYAYALAEIIFAAYLILAIAFPKYRPKKNVLLLALTLFIGLSVLSAIQGADVFNSFWSKYERMTGLLTWFHLLALFLATSSVLTKKDWFKVLQVSVMVAFVVSIISILPRFNIAPLEKFGYGTRGGATLGNSSFFASYLLFNVFFGLYLFLMAIRGSEEKIDNWFRFLKIKGDYKITTGILFLVLTIALVFSTGRAALGSFFLGMLLLFFAKLILCERGKLKLVGILFLLIFAIGGIGSVLLTLQQEGTVSKVLADNFSIKLKDRILVWGIGLEGWREKPLLGWGPENFDLVFVKNFSPLIFLPEYGADIWYDRAHNIVVDTLVSGGAIGLFSYLLIFASVAYVLYKKHKKGEIEFLTLGIFTVVLLSYFLQNLTVFDMISSLLMLFVVLSFVGTIASNKEEEEGEIVLKPKLVFAVLFLFLFPVMFLFTIQPLRSNTTLIKALQTPETEERIALMKKSEELSPLGRYQMRENFDRYAVELGNKEVADVVPLEYQKKELDFAIQELEKNIEESPLRYASYLKLGKLYNIYARIDPTKLDLAQDVLEIAKEIGPGNQQAYWTLAQTKLFQGKFDEGIAETVKAIELEPNVERSHLIAIEVARVIAKVNRDTDYLTARVNEALKINPDWATDINKLLQQYAQ